MINMTSLPPNKQANIDITDLLSELKKGFISDMPVRLDEMESLILAMEKNESFQDDYENFYRNTHSLKGAAGSYGLHIITSICHALEDALNESKGNSALFLQFGVDYWLDYIDLMRLVLADLNIGKDNLSKHEEQLNKLQSKHISGGSYQTHCLVVTSSSVYENMLTSSLSQQGVKFSFCHDGYKALGRLLTESFDILISDLEVPILNGLALFGSLRLSDSRNKNIKSILLTSKSGGNYARLTDPDYVIRKDKDFSINLFNAISSAAKEVHGQKNI